MCRGAQTWDGGRLHPEARSREGAAARDSEGYLGCPRRVELSRDQVREAGAPRPGDSPPPNLSRELLLKCSRVGHVYAGDKPRILESVRAGKGGGAPGIHSVARDLNYPGSMFWTPPACATGRGALTHPPEPSGPK